MHKRSQLGDKNEELQAIGQLRMERNNFMFLWSDSSFEVHVLVGLSSGQLWSLNSITCAKDYATCCITWFKNVLKQKTSWLKRNIETF